MAKQRNTPAGRAPSPKAVRPALMSRSGRRQRRRLAQPLGAALIVSVAAILGTPASADPPRWNGPFIGVGSGFGIFNSNDHFTSAGGASLFVDDGRAGSGLLATLFAGYDIRVSRWLVAGVTADYDVSWLRMINAERFNYKADTTHALTGMWSIGTRMGYLASPEVLWYLAAGYTFADFENRHESTVATTRYAAGSTAGGPYLGLGAEAMLGPGVSLRAEYRVSDLGRELAYWNAAHTMRVDSATSVQTARIGLAWRLGDNGDTAAPSPAPIWNGVYFGAGLGGGVFKQDNIVRRTSVPIGINDYDGMGGDGALASFIVGVDRQILPGVVIGAFVDVDWTSMEYSYVSPPSGRGHFGLDHMFSLGARLGYVATPSTLLFATAGYAHAGFSRYELIGAASYDVGGYDGIFVGGGMETMLARNLALRGEFRWTALEERFIRISGLGADQFFQPSVQTGRFSIVYRVD